MRKLVIAAIGILLSGSNLYAVCTDEQRAEMIKQNLSAETIERACNVENSQPGGEGSTPSIVVINSGDQTPPGEWRGKDKYGIGFGPSLGFGLGSHIYGDYNLSSSEQIHLAFASESRSRETIFGEELLKTTRTSISGTYRYFPSQNSGWFVSGGAGLGSIKQDYNSSSWSDEKISATSTGSFVSIFGDGGWQGTDGYYFTINAFVGSTIMTGEEDNTSKIPADYSNHRTTAETDWEEAKQYSGLQIGFGWYL